MGMASKMLKGIGRRAADKVMDRVGGRLISRIADTSADAPSAFHEPKRDVYRHMQDGKLAKPPRSGDDAAGPTPSDSQAAESQASDVGAPAAGHDHSHDHDS